MRWFFLRNMASFCTLPLWSLTSALTVARVAVIQAIFWARPWPVFLRRFLHRVLMRTGYFVVFVSTGLLAENRSGERKTSACLADQNRLAPMLISNAKTVVLKR